MSYNILVANFKGGTGKTTDACILGYCLSKLGKKVFLLDLDPQKNATDFLYKLNATMGKTSIEAKNSLFAAIATDALSDSIVEVTENYFTIPSYHDFSNYPLFLDKLLGESDVIEKKTYLKNMIDRLNMEYHFDYVIIDTPPTNSMFTDTGVFMADGIIIATQPHEYAVRGSDEYISYLNELYSGYDLDFDILGIVINMWKKSSSVDAEIIKEMESAFGTENIFKTRIPYLERIKRWGREGLKDKGHPDEDFHDSSTMKICMNFANEFLGKVGDK